MDRTFHVLDLVRVRRIRSAWAWLLAIALAGLAGAVGSSAPHSEAANEIGDVKIGAPLDSSDRRS